MKRSIATLSLGALLLASSFVLAHEGKDHSRIAGTVDEVEDGSILVKTANGKTVSISVDENTKFRDAEGDRSHPPPRVGDRVVVRAAGGERPTADEVRFEQDSSAAGKRHSHGAGSNHPHDH